ncbi:hypothetical protein F0L68_37295 [Solihabitans fulvus]|uniref:OmpR/PhoB-type domain-containing protein n=1 Tax=Solihabitans fulvus TaxID=1892852 RepID=A0A5B2WKF3_9PSEU|nr:BTAD domain-containing putative transcriptional regulator [Solihabitans fulvus]KAA2251398.1 hypothetical protein F0L68_37295 [Solihabitans fulvus]
MTTWTRSATAAGAGEANQQLDVHVLGPLEVVRGDQVITPSAPKLRRMLALLAIRANTVVRTDQFIEELWEGRPPLSAVATLQTYVHHLRRTLRPASAPTGDGEDGGVRTSFGGYRLTLRPDALDVTRFHALVDRGRARLAGGDLAQASDVLGQALRLWRGPALADLSLGPILRSASVRLEETRKSALELRIDVDLRLGRHHDLVGELMETVEQYPTDEGLHARLLLCLYRANRRAEALQTYQRVRAALRRELGVEPSAELRQLHQSVLTADERLDHDTAAGSASAWVDQPPNMLPPSVSALVGRRGELARVRAALAVTAPTTAPVVAVVGPPGSGKSALCVHAAWRGRDTYPDGQLYHRLLDDTGAPVDPGRVLAKFLRAVGVPADQVPGSLAERSGMFRSWSADHRALVVLDDAVSAHQLLPLLPTGPRCATLVACRARLADPAIAATVDLLPLRQHEAVQLLTTVLGPCRLAADPEGVRRVLEVCEGLPLALRIVADRLSLRPHWTVRRLVDCMFSDLGELSVGDLDLRASLARTFHRMPAAARRTLLALSATDTGTVSIRAAAALLGHNETRTEALLEELVEFQLAEVGADTSGDFSYHVPRLFRGLAAGLPWPQEVPRPRQAQT